MPVQPGYASVGHFAKSRRFNGLIPAGLGRYLHVHAREAEGALESDI